MGSWKSILGKGLLGLGVGAAVAYMAPSLGNNKVARGAVGFFFGGLPGAAGAAFGGEALSAVKGATGGVGGSSGGSGYVN